MLQSIWKPEIHYLRTLDLRILNWRKWQNFLYSWQPLTFVITVKDGMKISQPWYGVIQNELLSDFSEI